MGRLCVKRSCARLAFWPPFGVRIVTLSLLQACHRFLRVNPLFSLLFASIFPLLSSEPGFHISDRSTFACLLADV